MVIFARIDDRLIHGQVVEGWVNYLKATCIFVADDKVAANALQRSIMQISVPAGLKVVIARVEELTAVLGSHAYDAERVIVLFSSPADALKAMDLGFACQVLNIGGMHYMPGKCRIMDVLSVDDSDREALKEILSRGVQVYVQTVPTERPLPLEKAFSGVCRA